MHAEPASAWMHAGGWGATGGHWGAVGGAGDGWHAQGTTGGGRSWSANGNRYGWHGSGSNGGQAGGNYHSWGATGANGGWATGSRYYGGSSWSAYHSPAVVNHYYGAAGCYSCGGWGSSSGISPGGAAAVGLVAGAAIGAAVASRYTIGTVYPALPDGCAYTPYGGAVYYTCNGVWFAPAYGANGTYYNVVPAP
jgi:hypothetical protein